MQICYIAPKQSKYIYDQEISFKITDANRLMKVACGLITMALANINIYAKGSKAILDKVDATGWELFGIAKGIGFWGAVLLMVVDIIKSIKKEDISGIIRICVKYSIWYATIYFAPQIIMLVVELFK